MAKEKLKEAIAENLNLGNFQSTETFNIADIGCSIGPNTFFNMQLITEAVEEKCASQGFSAPEFQVFFNDHSSNDFNTLFTSFPPDRRYFAMGAPGSFHGRLFPKASLHFVHSSYALHWLSELPREVLDKKSPAWNEGRIYFVGAPEEVMEAFLNQYRKDIGRFLSARAQELVVGGMMALLIPACEERERDLNATMSLTANLVGSALMDMANESIIEKAKVDSFNFPIFHPCAQEFVEIVECNGCFNIEKIELVQSPSKGTEVIDTKTLVMHVRSGMGQMIGKHFGNGILGELFERYENKIEENSHLFKTANTFLPAIFVVLKRKA